MEFILLCDKFEKGLGVMLKNAWLHVEVLQTTDIPALVNHIADVFQGALDTLEFFDTLVKKCDVHQRQETLVFYYLFGLLKHIDDIGEHRYLNFFFFFFFF
jgi:hypothetical protein